MVPRMQSAGIAGIVAGVALAIGFILFLTSGMIEVMGDPAAAIASVNQKAGMVRLVSVVFFIAVAFAVVFVAGLAAKLRDRTPTRATATLYFGLLGLAGHGLGALLFLTAIPAVAAVQDQVAASHAWVAVMAVDGATDGLGTLFAGLAFLMAGWAITTTKVLGTSLGWGLVIAGLVGIVTPFYPQSQTLFFASFVLPIIALLWAGNTLRTAT